MTYEQWTEDSGIIPDEESREAWDYQQEIIDKLVRRLQSLGQKGYDDV